MYESMTPDELAAARTDLNTRRLAADEGFRAEARAIKAAEDLLEAKAKVASMTDAEREQLQTLAALAAETTTPTEG